MKASELRIGNLVYNKEENIVYVNTNHLTLLLYGIENEFKPIPLTEEWLLKFGLEDKKTCFNLSRKEILGHDFGDFAVSKYDDTQMKVWRGHKYIGVCHVQYVHQLQNLYFVLTGEELTFKS